MFTSIKINPEHMNCAYPVIKETVPRTERGYTTNNKYNSMPPLMNDGRSITATFQQCSVANADIIKQNNIKSNWQYRQYLTNNGLDVMKYNFTESSNDMGYYKRYTESINAPKQVKFDTPSPLLFKSDLKDVYLSREQLNSIKSVPITIPNMYK